MGRCGCSSVEAVGAAAVGTNCIGVSGAGTPGSPFAFSPILDPAADNRLSCGPSGLLVATPLGVEISGPVTSGAPLSGGAWPADFTVVQFRKLSGVVVVTTNGTGLAPIAWPAFASGVADLQVTPGGTIAVPNATSSWQIAVHDVNTSGCHVQCDHSDGSPIPGGLLDVFVSVTGW